MENKLLIVDDEESILRTLTVQLSLEGYKVITANSGKKALELLKAEFIPVIISDQRMPEMTGTELLQRIKALYPATVRILLSGYTDFQAVSNAINDAGIYKFIFKPWDENDLLQSIKNAFEYYHKSQKKDEAHKLLDSALEAIMVTDADGNIESVNTAFYLMTEHSDVVGKKLQLFKYQDNDNASLKEIHESIIYQGIWQGELPLVKKSSKIEDVFVSISALKDDHNQIQKYIYSFIDQKGA